MLTPIVRLIKKAKYQKRFTQEYKQFQKNQSNSPKGYAAFRKLFVLTRGKSNDALSAEIDRKIGKYSDVPLDGILANFTPELLQKAVTQMQKDGYYVFEQKLDAAVIDEIYRYAQQTPARYIDVNSATQAYSQDQIIFDAQKPVSPRYQFNDAQVLACAPLQKLIFDRSLFAFAQEYLGCKPILDIVAFWWSAPFGGKAKNAAAQMYHFDLDRIKFIKFFFYLTDVDTHTGPHCYVKGSHQTLPREIDRDGRFEDQEMTAVYGAENVLELAGKKGTIMAVDTRGFHKGKELEYGERLLFQIQYTNSMFGQSYAPFDGKLILPEYTSQIQQYSYSYQNIAQ
ncbi:MAG: phytanoyl-CoA dioxygenase family protein [Flavobacteriaceae bacterium]